MKYPLLILFSLVFIIPAAAQEFPEIDTSPGDIAYFPTNFAHDRKSGDKPIMKIFYNRPQKKGREIFGKLVPFDTVWRTGANEATNIQLFQDVTFNGKKLPAGTYSIFTIPGEQKWTVIFSDDVDYWGAYSYKEENDALRVEATIDSLPKPVEAFAIQMVSDQKNSGKLYFAWDTTVAILPFTY